MSLMGLFLFCVAFGGVLLLTSLFLGGDAELDADMDADADFDADADADADAEAGSSSGFEWSVLPFGSLRFWTFLVETFGLTGALLTLANVPSGLALTVAIAVGSGVGWSAFHFFRMLAREEVSGDVGLRSLLDQEARVLLPIRPGQVGKIAVETLAGRVELQAVSGDTQSLQVSATVLVVGIDPDGRAEVTSLSPRAPPRGDRDRDAAAAASARARAADKQTE